MKLKEKGRSFDLDNQVHPIGSEIEMSNLDNSTYGLEGGDEVVAEIVEQQEDETSKFLNTIPPNWEKAELHATANLVLDGSKTTLNASDKESFCLCCHMPYPEDEHYFPLCVDNLDLGAMGPGYPLFFEFMKMVGYLMTLLTIVYFLPCAFMMYDAYKEIKDDLAPGDSVISLFSFGAFVHHVDDEKYSYLDFEKRKKYVGVVATLVLVSIILSFLFLIWMRSNLLQKALKLDADAFTPSDFCIMGMTMKFDDYSPDAITDKIKEVFKERWEIEVEYVNIAYTIADFYKLSEKFNNLTKLQTIAKQYCVKEKMNEKKYR